MIRGVSEHPIFARFYDRMIGRDGARRPGRDAAGAARLGLWQGARARRGDGPQPSLLHGRRHRAGHDRARPAHGPAPARAAGGGDRRAAGNPTVVEAPAEQLPFDDGSFDAVVATLVFCTVEDPQRALAEARRVLVEGGRLLYLEHVRSSRPGLGRWQDLLQRPWGFFAGGCHPNRPTDQAIADAGFWIDSLERDKLPKAPPLRPAADPRGRQAAARESGPARLAASGSAAVPSCQGNSPSARGPGRAPVGLDLSRHGGHLLLGGATGRGDHEPFPLDPEARAPAAGTRPRRRRASATGWRVGRAPRQPLAGADRGLLHLVGRHDRLHEPESSASRGLSVRPSSIICIARPTPTSRGRRCVPPAPGLKSIVISGRPIAMSVSAISRMSQARESLAAPAGRRPVDRRDEDHVRAVHLQEQVVDPVELEDGGERRPLGKVAQARHPAHGARDPQDHPGEPGRRRDAGPLDTRQDLADVVVGDVEVVRLARDHNGADRVVAVHRADQLDGARGPSRRS